MKVGANISNMAQAVTLNVSPGPCGSAVGPVDVFQPTGVHKPSSLPGVTQGLRREAAAVLRELGAVEEERIQALLGDEPPCSQQLATLSKRHDVLQARQSRIANHLDQLANGVGRSLPSALSLTITYGLTVGIPGVVGVGPGAFLRLNNHDTGRAGIDAGVSLGASVPSAWGAVVAGKQLGDLVAEGAVQPRKGAYGGVTCGPFAVSGRHPTLGYRCMGVYIPHLLSLTLTDAGSIGGSVSMPIPFLPVLRQGFGLYVEHPWCATLTRPVFAFYDRALGLAKRLFGNAWSKLRPIMTPPVISEEVAPPSSKLVPRLAYPRADTLAQGYQPPV